MAGRPSQRLRGKITPGEVNLLPVMNLIAILLPVLLMSVAFVKFTIIKIQLPEVTSAKEVTQEDVSPTPEPDPNKPSLTVIVRQDGFQFLSNINPPAELKEQVAAMHELIELSEEKDLEGKSVLVDGRPYKTYDYQALNERLIQFKELQWPLTDKPETMFVPFENVPNINIYPMPEIKYEVIIGVLDAARTYPQADKYLFPTPILVGRIYTGELGKAER